jgi:hypothetical protein
MKEGALGESGNRNQVAVVAEYPLIRIKDKPVQLSNPPSDIPTTAGCEGWNSAVFGDCPPNQQLQLTDLTSLISASGCGQDTQMVDMGAVRLGLGSGSSA